MSSENSTTNGESYPKLPRPNVLGSISGSRSVSGSITGLEATGSFDELSLRARSESEDQHYIHQLRVRSNTDTSVLSMSSTSSTTRGRLYSEEDEEIRLAKAMALAIQNHPNMHADEIRELVKTEVLNRQSLAAAKTKRPEPLPFQGRPSAAIPSPMETPLSTSSFDEQQKRRNTSVKTNLKSFQESIRVSQKKAKERLQGMVHGASIKEVSTSTISTITTTSAPGDKSPNVSPSSSIPRSMLGSPLRSLVVNPAADTKSSTPALPLPLFLPSAASYDDGDNLSKKKSEDSKRMTKSFMASMVGSPIPPSLDETKKIRLTAIVWKRRSGLGKLSVTKAWERRRIVLQGTKLFYFYHKDTDEVDDRDLLVDVDTGSFGLEPSAKKQSWFEQAALNLEKAKGNWVATLGQSEDPSTPRGYVDLVKEQATVAAATGHSGAPTPFAISIKVKGDTYWKLCFDKHPMQMEWLAALTDVVVTASVDAYNVQLLAAADPTHHEIIAFHGSASVMAPPPLKESDEHEGGHRLWMLESYHVTSSRESGDGNFGGDHDDDDADDSSADTAVIEASDRATSEEDVTSTTTSTIHPSDDILDLSEDTYILRDKEVYAAVVIINVALVYSHASSTTPEGFWYIVTFANLGLWFCLVKDERTTKTSEKPISLEPQAVVKPTVGEVRVSKKVRDTVPDSASAVVDLSPVKVEDGFKPIAGTSTVRIENPTDLPVNAKNEVFAGFRSPAGESLLVRSHGYLVTKKKVPSPGELYHCAFVDIFESPNRFPDMARRVELPKVTFEGDDGIKSWRSPDVFVVSVALPTDPPKLRGGSDDGGGYTITIYFTMKQETRDILRRVTAEDYDPTSEQPEDPQVSKVNAVKLFEEWCRRAPTDPQFQSRFKLVPNAQNLKEIGMPAWISKYNGKPVLIKRPGQTGFLFNHPELSAMEFDISLHPFPYLAKQAICYMKENFFKKVLVTFGFVIEGRSDDELPECVIGLMQLCYPDPAYAIQAQDFFAGTSNRSF